MNPVTGAVAPTKLAGAAAEPRKLAKAVQEFEGVLLSTWLEKLQESFAGQDDGSDPAHGTLASMGTQAIASALAVRGGIGIAKLLMQHLGPTRVSAGTAAGLATTNDIKITPWLKFVAAASDKT